MLFVNFKFSLCLALLICLLFFFSFFFFFFFFAASLDLRCTTQDELIKAIEKTKKYYTHSNFNSLTNQEGIILPIQKPPSCKAVSYSDTEVKQNDASLDCLLRNATEGDYIKYLLQPTGKKYVTTDWTLDMCVYEAIVNSLYSTLSKDEHLLINYTGLDLKNQTLIYILKILLYHVFLNQTTSTISQNLQF